MLQRPPFRRSMYIATSLAVSPEFHARCHFASFFAYFQYAFKCEREEQEKGKNPMNNIMAIGPMFLQVWDLINPENEHELSAMSVIFGQVYERAGQNALNEEGFKRYASGYPVTKEMSIEEGRKLIDHLIALPETQRQLEITKQTLEKEIALGI